MEPVVCVHPEAKQFRFWRPCGTLNVLGAFVFYRTFNDDRTPVVARVFYLVLVSPDFGFNGSGIIRDFGIFSPFVLF